MTKHVQTLKVNQSYTELPKQLIPNYNLPLFNSWPYVLH